MRSLSFVVAAYLSVSISLQANSILPTTFYCQNQVPLSDFCSGSANSLPAFNGIQGTAMTFSATYSSGDSTASQFEIVGDLAGDNLAAGTMIPYSFSISALSINPGGTEIVNDVILPIAQSVTEFSFPGIMSAELAFGVPQTTAITHDGNCAPFPSEPGNTCWGRSVTGTGTFELSSEIVPSGTLIAFPLFVEIDTSNLLGTPNISISGTIDFNPVPEPRYTSLAILSCILALLLWRRRAVAA